MHPSKTVPTPILLACTFLQNMVWSVQFMDILQGLTDGLTQNFIYNLTLQSFGNHHSSRIPFDILSEMSCILRKR